MTALDLVMALAVAVVLGRQGVLLMVAGSRKRPVLPVVVGPVDVVVPAFNEQETLQATVAGALACAGVGTVIIVDDGSTDGTGVVARALASADARVVSIAHGHNRGKPAALNTGLARAATPIVATLDADTVPDCSALLRLCAGLEDSAVAASACNVRVASPDGWLQRWQHLEYVTSIHLGRRAQAHIGALATVPGALAVWRADAVRDAGGFSSRSLAEDTDLTLTLQRRGHTVVFVDDALAFTRVPATVRALVAQRRRWLLGNLQCAWHHRGVFRDGPPALRRLAVPDLWWTHLGVYLLLPLSLVWLLQTSLSPGLVLGLGAVLLAVDLAGTAIALRSERMSWTALFDAPAQRLLFPFGMWAVFLSITLRLGFARFAGRRPHLAWR